MRWSSQAGQDEFVYSIIGDGGFFLDVGAHDGVVHSNTYALETHYGWSGICVEPDPEPYRELVANRTCYHTDLAASAHVDYITVYPSGVHRMAWPLSRILEHAHAPFVIDYLSIDVEGHELKVLAGMDFERWRVKLITIEHNLYMNGPMQKEAVMLFLKTHGFEVARENVVAPGYGVYEDWYRNVELRAS